jgi:hypothetical protein
MREGEGGKEEEGRKQAEGRRVEGTVAELVAAVVR